MPAQHQPDTETKGGKPSALSANTAQVQRFAKQLAVAGKAAERREPGAADELAQTLKLAAQIDWPRLVECLREDTEAERNRLEKEIDSRREDLVRASLAESVPMAIHARSARVGIFTVNFEGATSVISLGGLRLAECKETDGGKLLAAIQKCRASLDAVTFNREQFFQELKTAMEHCHRLGAASNGYIPLRDLHREVVLERARRSDRFRRAPEPKNMEPYPLSQFVFDLWRFGKGGWAYGSEKLATEAPSMRQNRDTLYLPNLGDPLAQETAVARLAIKTV